MSQLSTISNIICLCKVAATFLPHSRRVCSPSLSFLLPFFAFDLLRNDEHSYVLCEQALPGIERETLWLLFLRKRAVVENNFVLGHQDE